MMRIALVAAVCCVGLVLGSVALAKDPPKVPSSVHKAITAYLKAAPEKEAKALEKAVKACKGDVQLCAQALRTLPRLTKGRAGTKHGIRFTSDGREFVYSIHLPKGYDGKKRFPVLVLPDHGSVGEKAGIDFWVGKKDAEKYILFRPVICKHKNDRALFPDGQFFAIDQALALVMADALVHLRLHYAVDDERFSMTGLSQAGYYTWYYAVSFPDTFAAIVPESAGGMAVRASIVRLAPNLKDMQVRILHHPDDQITPFRDAVRMRDALQGVDGHVELISYSDEDYGGNPFPKRHPGPHHLRLQNVLSWAHAHKRTIPTSLGRVVRYHQQGVEGKWFVLPSGDPTKPFTLNATNDGGKLSADQPGVSYLVSPEELAAKTTFRVDGKRVKVEPDIGLMLEMFKAGGDRGRLVAARIRVTE